MKMITLVNGEQVQETVNTSHYANGLLTEKGHFINFNVARRINPDLNMLLLDHVEKFYNIFDKTEREAVILEMNKKYSNVFLIYAMNNDNGLYTIRIVENVNIYNITSYQSDYKDSNTMMYVFFKPAIYDYLKSVSNWVKYQSIRLRHNLTSTDIRHIHTYIRNKEVNHEHKTIITSLPEALKGNYGLLGMPLFLQLTDKLKHTGFIYIDGKLHCANTHIFSGSHAKNKIAYFNECENHYYPSDWVHDSDLDLIIPKNYAENIASEIYINEGDEQMEIDHNDMSYDATCGYYDNDTRLVIDGELINRDETVCLHNGEIVHEDDAVYVEDEGEFYLESDCVRLANGNWNLRNNSIRLDNGDWYADNDDEIASCDDCGDNFHLDDLMYNENTGENYCESCRDNHGSLYRKGYGCDVLDYKGYGKTSLFINKEPVYLGLELETYVHESNDDEVNNFSSSCSYAIPTEDGSLDSNRGCEFIFRPEGLETQKDNVNNLIDKIGSCLNHRTKDTYDKDYGLHVHVSSHFLGFASKLKIQKFVSRCATNFRKYVGKRDHTEYQRSMYNDKFIQLNTDRYHMVNIGNPKTIEFRFPAGIVSKNHINLNLENALAVTMFCKFELSVMTLRSDKSQAWEQYVEYVIKNKKQFPLLSDAMQSYLADKTKETANETTLANCA